MSNLTFLYMEDDDLSRKIMRLLLEASGHTEIYDFEESSDFFEKIASLPQIPDVIFLDIHMNPYDGFEMLEMLRQNERYGSVKIVALTASVMNEEISRLRNAGFDSVIAKPIDQEHFPNLLSRILQGEQVWRVK